MDILLFYRFGCCCFLCWLQLWTAHSPPSPVLRGDALPQGLAGRSKNRLPTAAAGTPGLAQQEDGTLWTASGRGSCGPPWFMDQPEVGSQALSRLCSFILPSQCKIPKVCGLHVRRVQKKNNRIVSLLRPAPQNLVFFPVVEMGHINIHQQHHHQPHNMVLRAKYITQELQGQVPDVCVYQDI